MPTFSWQEMSVVRIWQISISLGNISSANVLTTITSVLYISFQNLWCQYIFFTLSVPNKNSPRFFFLQFGTFYAFYDFFSPQFGTFYAWQSCARWKRQMLCKNNISFSFLCQLYVAGKSFDDGEETNLFFLIVQTLLCAADFCIFSIFFWTNLVYFSSFTFYPIFTISLRRFSMGQAKVIDKVFVFKRYHRNNERCWRDRLKKKRRQHWH